MKKKNLKTLRLTKSTISHLNLQSIKGGTQVITDIIRTLTANESATTCSKYVMCDSMLACPPTIKKTQFKNDDTSPASLCAEREPTGVGI
ncbi:hypothetical protein [uncultured Kordia sp.]|uniref:hypothetical protein n=1 Tax=uncultured Kordia sp. TaxID=507699 RepID=UPI0026366B87|nr:hypothetical protein [uncultured Kordia sp.]